MSKYPFPKIDLHLHLDGSMLPETAWELAHEQGVKLPAEDLESFRKFIVVSADCRSVNEYLKRFDMPLALMQDKKSITRVTRELVCLLADQGLSYAEIRFAPQLHLKKGLTQRDAVEAVLEGRREGLSKHPEIGIGIILCTMCVGTEDVNMKENLETVEIAPDYIGKGVVAIDLAGAEGIVPLRNFAYIFDRARELGVPFTCHAGDSQDAETVRDALDFGAKRIGHGHHIFEDKELCERAIREGVTFEICPTSNIQCQARESYEKHPAKAMLDMGMKVTINTDNMILSDIDLEKEYAHCLNDMGFTMDDLIKCAHNSVEAAFTSPEEKERLMGLFS